MTPIENFNQNIIKVKENLSIYQIMSSSISKALDLTDILRMSLVFAISALDCYVHDLVVAKALWIIKNASTPPLRFDKLKTGYVLLFNVHTNGRVDRSYEAIESSLRKSLSWQSFQHPDKISEIIGSITDNDIWQELENNINEKGKEIRKRLELIAQRRDSIVHEADINPITRTSSPERYPIDYISVKQSVEFIEQIINKINSIVWSE